MNSGFASVEAAQSIGARMARAIANRGPDDAGVWADGQTGVCLAHRRLSIIDLSAAGSQPMHSASSRFVLSFNGEIYNHLSLRAELEQAGKASVWRGHSDTETLLAAFENWGIDLTLRKTVGMFALALWDRRERRLTLARDRIGEKPLYYGWVGEGAQTTFIFGSELKALRAHPAFDNAVNRDAIALYLSFNAVPAPYCIYEEVRKLEPGSFLNVEIGCLMRKSVEIAPYWSFREAAHRGLAAPIKCEAEALAELEFTLSESVALQAVADVPLGAFLSGGVDSSTIVALMQARSNRKVQTFTIGFDEEGFDEAPHARAVARHLGTDHHELRVSSGDALAVIARLPELYDEPFADSSQIPTYLVCQAARRQVTVALSGDGGDELFGGYNRYFWGKRIWRRLDSVPAPLRRLLGAILVHIPIGVWDCASRAFPYRGGISRLGEKAHRLGRRMQTVESIDDLYRSLVMEWSPQQDLVIGARFRATLLDDASFVSGVAEPEHRMMLLDSVTYLPDDILTKVDRAAMGVSLETRAPFLDHRVVELAWRLPLHMKIRNGQGKWALRQILYKYVPKELIERPKAGFAIPIGEWLRGPLREWAESLLDGARLAREGFLRSAPIRETWRQHLSGRHDWSPRLWSILMFQAWLEANS